MGRHYRICQGDADDLTHPYLGRDELENNNRTFSNHEYLIRTQTSEYRCHIPSLDEVGCGNSNATPLGRDRLSISRIAGQNT
jgi:hypothetical protein